MRVLLATLYANYGGSTRVLLASQEALALDHTVVLRAPLDKADSRCKLCIPAQTLKGLWRKLVVIPRFFAILLQEWLFLRTVKVDIIYVHDEPSLYVYGVIARILRLRLVWHIHMEEGRGLKRWVRNLLCDVKIHVSEFSRRASVGKSVLIRNPVTVTLPRPRGTIRKIEDIYVLGSICRRKNQLIAVEAVNILRRRGIQVRLHLCGDVLEKDYYREVKNRVFELLLGDTVSFDGYVRAADAYTRADLILCPSRYENQPLVFIEALAAGLRVIASDIPAHREIAELVGLSESAMAPLTPESLADAIVNAEKLDVRVCTQKVQEIFGLVRFGTELRKAFRSFAECWALAAPN